MSETPKRIQRKRTKGWRMPENTVYVGRPSRWGNPFQLSKSLSRERALILFRALLEHDWARLRDMPWTAGIALSHGPFSDIPSLVAPLSGKDLACWCKEGEPCHADVLLEFANMEVDAK